MKESICQSCANYARTEDPFFPVKVICLHYGRELRPDNHPMQTLQGGGTMNCPDCDRELHATVYISGKEIGVYCPYCKVEWPTDTLVTILERRSRRCN